MTSAITALALGADRALLGRWPKGLGDDLFSLFSGRNNEGLTDRIQSNNIRRLLLNESSSFTTTFVFSKGQYDSEDLHNAVWGNTLMTF